MPQVIIKKKLLFYNIQLLLAIKKIKKTKNNFKRKSKKRISNSLLYIKENNKLFK